MPHRSIVRTFTPPTLIILALLALLTACRVERGGLLRPNGVAVAPDGTLYVMDRGHYRIVHLSADGEFLGAFGRLGVGPNDIYRGWDAAVDQAGNIYICNVILSEEGGVTHDGVKVFSPRGRLLREIGASDTVAGESSNNPYGLDIDHEGRVYVANLNTNQVKVFDAQGRLLASLFGTTGSGPGEFHDMMDVAVDDPRGLLYVVDSVNSRVQQFTLTFTPSGIPTVTHRLSFGEYGRGPGQFSYPQTIAVDHNTGRVYVGDMGNLRVQAFDPEGTFVRAFAPSDVEIWQVLGLAVGEDGAIYAADAFNNVLWVFEPDGQLRRRIEVSQ